MTKSVVDKKQRLDREPGMNELSNEFTQFPQKPALSLGCLYTVFITEEKVEVRISFWK